MTGILKPLVVPPDTSTTKGVVVKYEGNTDLTIDPAIASSPTVSSLKKGDTVQILKSSSKNEFSANGSVIASVWNRSDMNKVEIEGGNGVSGTDPFTITIKLTQS